MEMVDNDCCFLPYRLGTAFHIRTDFLLSLLLVKLGVAIYGLNHFVEAGVCRVVLQHIHNETFFYGLLHRIFMKRQMLHLAVWLWTWCTEHLQSL